MNDGIQIVLAAFGAIVAWTTTAAGLVWWLSRQFSSVRELVYKQSDRLREKIDDHEKLDEERFNNLGLRMQRVEIAADIEGKFIPRARA